jgi:hypothetical protein
MTWREAFRKWAFRVHEYRLPGVELFWYWHCQHSWACGFRREASGRFVRLDNGHGHEDLDDVGLRLTLDIQRPGKLYQKSAG